MDTSISTTEFCGLIGIYEHLSVVGERVELIITPYYHDGIWDNSKRVITLGSQGGSSTGRVSYIVEDNGDFDKLVLPRIVSYYTANDNFNFWDIVDASEAGSTFKGVTETEHGNLLYIETFNPNLFDDLSKEKEQVEEKVQYKEVQYTNEEKAWDEIICYAKRRRVWGDFYNDPVFSEDERRKIYNFVIRVSQEKEISASNKKQRKDSNKEYVYDLFAKKDRLLELGLDNALANKLIDNLSLDNLAELIGAEKRIRNRVDFDNPEIQAMIDFAISELNKVDYFSLKNASVVKFEKGNLVSTQPAVIKSLKEKIEASEIYSDDIKIRYSKYCDEIYSYLEKKSGYAKKVATTTLPPYEVDFVPYDDSIKDSYEKLEETLELVKGARVGNEKYEVAIRNNAKNPDIREVRVSLIGGFSRSDTFNFVFTNGKEFDEKIRVILSNISTNDMILVSEKDYLSIDATAIVEEVSEEENIELEVSKENEDDLQGLFDAIVSVAEEQDKQDQEKAVVEIEELGTSVEPERKLINTLVDFDTLKKYAETFELGRINSDGKLKIYYRSDHSDYIPNNETEKRNIEFAIYWLTMVGIDAKYNENILGITDAYSSENKKLFDVINNYFTEVVKNNEDVNLELLKSKVEETGIKDSLVTFNRLFKDKNYVNYVKQYYEKSLIEQEEVTKEPIRLETRKINRIPYNTIREIITIYNAIKDYDDYETMKKLYPQMSDEEFNKCSNLAKKYSNMAYNAYLSTARTIPIREVEETISYLTEASVPLDKPMTLWLNALKEEETRRKSRNSAYEINIDIPRYIDHPEDVLSASDKDEVALIFKSFEDKDRNGRFGLTKEKELYTKYERMLDKTAEVVEEKTVIEEATPIVKEVETDPNKKEPENYSKEELAVSAEVSAQNLINESTDILQREGAKVQAEMLNKENENEEIKEAALKLAELLKMREDALATAESIIRQEEAAEIKEGAEEQARILVQQEQQEQQVQQVQETNEEENQEDENKNMFEVVEHKDDEEYGPELRNMENAYEKAEELSTDDKPSNIKIIFNKNNSKQGTVIISNGEITENEKIHYQDEFDIDKIETDIIPHLLFRLFEKNNSGIAPKCYLVPPDKGRFFAVGDNGKEFAIVNAPYDLLQKFNKELRARIKAKENGVDQNNMGKSL